MIIVQLIGGLGNQLFQYSLGRMLAIRRNVPLKIDISGFDACKKRTYTLCNFHIAEEFATSEDLNQFKLAHASEDPHLPFYQRSVVMEPSFCYTADILKVSANACLAGYWQSEKYFSGIEQIIRQDLLVKSDLSDEDRNIAKAMAFGNAISLHIRRGDYVSSRHINNIHGVCTLKYYRNAVELIASKVGNPRFFIFSDDKQWAAEHLRLDYPVTYVNHNGANREFADLWLMSQCQHHIIANSSFSWWGAWLNNNSSKMVIAPDPWFLDTSIDTRDLLPETWHKIPQSLSHNAEESGVNSIDSAFILAKQGQLPPAVLLATAEMLVMSNQTDRCISLYRLWLEHHVTPRQYMIYFSLGVVLHKVGDFAGAEQAYRQAIGLNPGFSQAQQNLALLFRQQGRSQAEFLSSFKSEMERKKTIFICDASFAHASNNSTNPFYESQYVTWDRSGVGVSEKTVYTDFEIHKCNGGVGLLLEPLNLIPKIYGYVMQNSHKYKAIWTYEKTLLDTLPNAKFTPSGACTIHKHDWLIHEKSRMFSIIASKKNFLQGHKLRHEVIKNIQINIDLYGYGYNPVEFEIEALKDYRYHIAIENCKRDYYFTQKLFNCFFTGTIPIYWGCPSIYKFFNVDGIIVFDSIHELNEKLSLCTPEFYESKLPAIKENFEIALKEYVVLEDWLYRHGLLHDL